MKNKKAIILSVIASLALFILIIGATYAYFQASGGDGTSTNLRVTTYTTDVFNFEIGDDISIYADQTSFGSGKGNALGTTFAKAILTANNKTNTTSEHYNLYLNISDNNFKYAIGTSSPDLLLTIKDGNNNEITSISGLEHKTVTDAKGTQISGFDITTKTGLLTLLDNREITASPTKTDTWNITVTLINYDNDQSVNMGKTFSGQILIGKDNYDSYTPNTINTLSATRSGSNLTVKLNVEQGSNEIDKYYFAIKEKDTLAINNIKSKIQRLSNVLATSNLTYVESTSNSYTFNNIKDDINYEISAYAIDKKKVKTNVYNYNYRTDNYNLPVISKVETKQEEKQPSSEIPKVDTDTKKDITAWDELGITEDEYYNSPAWSWAKVDFAIEKYGSQEECLNACIEYGESTGMGYSCSTINSFSGRYLGEMLKLF